MHTDVSWWMWAAFSGIVTFLLVLDLGVFHRKAHTISIKEAAIWTVVWIAVSLVFNMGVYTFLGTQTGLEFLTGYVLEKALSVDNLFVFFLLFSYFSVPNALQHRVLFWGILGAIVTRGAFIFVGAALIHKFHWIMYFFGAFLVFTGIKILFGEEKQVEPEKNPALRLAKRFLPVTNVFCGKHFFVRQNGRLVATPLFLVLIVVEATDVVFAVDSIPAVFAVTTDPFVVLTSNIFAILGLRSLYFLIARVIEKFRFLKFGLGLVLAYVGVKMLAADWFKIPVQWSLLVIVAILGGSGLLSLLFPNNEPAKDKQET